MTSRDRLARTAALLAHPLTVVTRPVWIGCDGWLRIGRTGDMVQMMDDIGVQTRA
jgi:hypothetical protein